MASKCEAWRSAVDGTLHASERAATEYDIGRLNVSKLKGEAGSGALAASLIEHAPLVIKLLQAYEKAHPRASLPKDEDPSKLERGPAISGCHVVQYSDMMECKPCDLRWDTNDSSPPLCKHPSLRSIPASTEPKLDACPGKAEPFFPLALAEPAVAPFAAPPTPETVRANRLRGLAILARQTEKTKSFARQWLHESVFEDMADFTDVALAVDIASFEAHMATNCPDAYRAVFGLDSPPIADEVNGDCS